jgi:hypothetical protein
LFLAFPDFGRIFVTALKTTIMNSKKLLLGFLIVFTLPVFAQQPDWSLIPYRQGNLWGYARPDRSIVIPPVYDDAKLFFAGYAAVSKNGKYGYIDRTGKLVIPIKYYEAKPFRYGYYDRAEKRMAGGKLVQNQDSVLFAAVSTKPGVEVCIDVKGRTSTRCPAINEQSVPSNRQTVTTTTQKVYSLVNNANLYDKLVDDYKVAADDHTYYIGMKNGMYGVINNTFDVVVPFEYQALTKTDVNGTTYLLAQKNGMYGLLQGNGTLFTPVDKNKLAVIRADNGNVYFVETSNGVTSIKDATYHVLANAGYTDVTYDDQGGFVLTGTDNMKGFYFTNNKMVPPLYANVRLLRGGQYLQVTTKSGKTGYISSNGVVFFED